MNRDEYINQVITESRNDSIEVPEGIDKLVDLFDEIVKLEKRRAELAEALKNASDAIYNEVLQKYGVSIYTFGQRKDLYDFLLTGDVFTAFIKDVKYSNTDYAIESYERENAGASGSKAELLDELKRGVKDAIVWALDEKESEDN